MKRYIKTIMLTLAVAGLVASPNVMAQEVLGQPSADTPIDRLTMRCDAIQGNLRRLHTADALMRINIGQMYTGISVRLMARLNSRLALNRVDSTDLVEITGRFEDQHKEFKESYSKYEVAISAVIKKGCKSDPADYYQKLLVARERRSELAQSAQLMNESIREYQMSVEQMKHQMFSDEAGGEDQTTGEEATHGEG